jgi:hypothetical protein
MNTQYENPETMHKKLISLLALVCLLVLAAPSYAQGASTDDGGGGIPIPVIAAVAAVIIALVTRNIMGLGSRRGTAIDDEFDEDDILVERPRRGGRKKRGGKRRGPDIDDDPETYLIERDQVWEDDGYGGEDDVGF